MTIISSVVDVMLLLGRKQRSLVHGTCGLFTLHTLLKAVLYCLQLNTGGGSDDNLKVDFLGIDAVGWRSMYNVVMPNQVSKESR